MFKKVNIHGSNRVEVPSKEDTFINNVGKSLKKYHFYNIAGSELSELRYSNISNESFSVIFKHCDFSSAQCFFFLKEILIHYRWKVTFDAVTSLMCTIYVFFLCPAKQTIPSSEYGTTAILQFHCRNNGSEGFQLTAAI